MRERERERLMWWCYQKSIERTVSKVPKPASWFKALTIGAAVVKNMGYPICKKEDYFRKSI
jgi:hypothetical protein